MPRCATTYCMLLSSKHKFMKYKQEYQQDLSHLLCLVPKRHWLGDGSCERTSVYNGYNTKRCGWDGGDCCLATCVKSDSTDCSSFMECLDPDVQDEKSNKEVNCSCERSCCFWLSFLLIIITDANHKIINHSYKTR